jgi:hypothetical protein
MTHVQVFNGVTVSKGFLQRAYQTTAMVHHIYSQSKYLKIQGWGGGWVYSMVSNNFRVLEINVARFP